MFKTKKGLLLILLLLLFVSFLYLKSSPKNRQGDLTPQENNVNLPFIKVADNKIFVEIADTPEKKSQGLSGKVSLEENHGMLFTWDQENSPGFWMKDMNFPIDIIWIRDNKIIGIEENAQPQPGSPDTELKVFRSPGLIDAVLEVNAGYSKSHNLQVGSDVEYTSL